MQRYKVLGVHFFFFFSSRRRHTRLQGDWSSDVCSSDLHALGGVGVGRHGRRDDLGELAAAVHGGQSLGVNDLLRLASALGDQPVEHLARDRKSVVWGKSVDLGGRRIIKKKKIDGIWTTH